MRILAAMVTGFALDLIFGDPHWMPHPVRAIGWLIAWVERILRGERALESGKGAAGEAGAANGGAKRVWSPAQLRVLGAAEVLAVLSVCTAAPAALLWAAQLLSPWLAFALEALMCYQIFAARALRDESMKVFSALKSGDIGAARTAVSMIVGRDTQALDEAGIARAAVETVAENTSDGVVAPLLFVALGGAPLGFLYKAVNTMDSMLGYKNERYRDFGRCAARLDDAVNLLPARISAALMIAASLLLGLDTRGAARIFKRDRFCHASPNSAQTESVCAGALGLQLAGDAVYFGKTVKKPTIGDAVREIEPADIAQANRLMMATAVLTLLLCAGVRLAFLLLV